MERICSQCHAVLAPVLTGDTVADWCPACGGALTEREQLPADTPRSAAAEIDHRGVMLPQRHALGGIITPR